MKKKKVLGDLLRSNKPPEIQMMIRFRLTTYRFPLTRCFNISDLGNQRVSPIIISHFFERCEGRCTFLWSIYLNFPQDFIKGVSVFSNILASMKRVTQNCEQSLCSHSFRERVLYTLKISRFCFTQGDYLQRSIERINEEALALHFEISLINVTEWDVFKKGVWRFRGGKTYAIVVCVPALFQGSD